MHVRHKIPTLFHRGRPILRVQLTLLYSGLFLGLLTAALLATNLLIVRGSLRAGPNASVGATQVASAHHFGLGPAAIGLVASVLALAGAWWLAGRFLKPLRAMTTTAREISATNLHRRLSLSGPDDELTDLGKTLDSLFERLQASFESQRHFVANASHELRTPLAGQRTLLQVTLADPDANVETWRLTAEELLTLGDQQDRLIEALLTLASSERGIEQRESINLAQVVATTLEVHFEECERREIHAETSLREALIEGEPRLINILVANLLDNALRHNVVGGRIEIATATIAKGATISIGNTGALVPFDDMERLFEPFQQLGDERIRHADGHGFGLAIVRAVANAHGATLDVSGRPAGGVDVEVTFLT
jgi:signal transduction histidine kinase